MAFPRRAGVALLLPLFTLTACTSAARARQRAFIDAGLEIRKAATAQTHDDVLKDLELFIQRDIVLVKERARGQRGKEVNLYRAIWMTGAAAAVLAGTSGTLGTEGNEATRVGLGGIGLVAAVGGYILWAKRTSDLTACEAFLDTSREELESWKKASLRPGLEPVVPSLWQDYVARTTAIQRFDKCLSLRE